MFTLKVYSHLLQLTFSIVGTAVLQHVCSAGCSLVLVVPQLARDMS